MNSKRLIFGIITLLLVGVLVGGCGGDKYDKNVQTVRNGRFYMTPNVPVGKAFDQFFSDGKWHSFTSTDNETIVEFTGGCTWYNAPAKMLVQFNVEGENFVLRYVDINGVAMNFEDSASILEKVLSEYKH